MKSRKSIFDTHREGDTLIVTPTVNLSELLLEGLSEETTGLLAQLDDPSVKRVIIDLAKTEYFGSDFIAIMLKIWKRVRGRSGHMALLHVSEGEREVLQICELDRLWPICATLEEAHAAVQARAS